MRMRLRAPDEPEAESGSYEGEAAPSTPEHGHALPPLDVGSPEYIEERLENLKRRPNWGDFLDQYVQDHPDSDSDSEAGDVESVSEIDAPSFTRSTLWSLLVVPLAPLLLLCTPCLRHKGYGFWPLGCRSMKELLCCALANMIFLAAGLVLLYWTICRELPDVFRVDNTLVKLSVQMDEAQRAAGTCHAALLQWERAVAQELCTPVGIDAALLLINAWLLLHYHRRWARYLMVLMAVMFAVDMPAKMYDATFPAPEIHKVDPTFAMVDEELLVALDGKNLKPGGSVAWVAYWGCATTSNVDTCEKQFASTFEAGNVPVTFRSLDHFIPCYRDPPNPLKAQEYQCFEDVRIRVKDKQSIPGWSRSGLQASRAAKVESSLSNEWQDSMKFPGLKYEEVDTPTHSRQNIARSVASIDAAEIDICVSTLSPENLDSENYEQSELKKEAVDLSGEVVAQENATDEARTESARPSVLEAEIAAEKLEEIEVTPDAEVKVLQVNTKQEDAPQNEDDVLSKESEDVQESSDSQVDIEVGKTQSQANAIQTVGGQEQEQPTVDEAKLKQITVGDEEIKLSTSTVVVEDGHLQTALGSQEAQELDVDVARETGPSNYEAPSQKMEMQQFGEEATAPKDRTTQAQDTPSKKRKGSKRKAKKASESAGSTAAAV